MIITYDVYKRRSDGRRNILVQDYEKLTVTLNWKKLSNFSIEGKSTTKCPFELGDKVVIFRTSSDVDIKKNPDAEPTKLLFAGIVENVQIDCKDVVSEILEWSVSGKEDSVIFDWRVILTENGKSKNYENLTFDGNEYDKCEDTAYARMIHYLRNCFDASKTPSSRAISGVQFPEITDIPASKRGTTNLSAYRLKKLSEALREIGEEVDEDTGETNYLYAKYEWSPFDGSKVIDIPLPTDKTKSIIISPQFGNCANWSVQRTYPKFNAVWVCSGDYEEVENEGEDNEKRWLTRVWVYMEDKESIKKFGRIENVITKSDIKITDDDEETEEDETLTAQDVIKLLKEEAKKALRENAAKEKYKVELAEIEDMHFMTNWNVGDIVRVIIDYDEETGLPKNFNAPIESVEVTYSKLEEKVKPTIGEVEEGLFGDIFKMIAGLDTRLQSEEGTK